MQRGVTKEEEENPRLVSPGPWRRREVKGWGGGGASAVAKVEKETLLLQE